MLGLGEPKRLAIPWWGLVAGHRIEKPPKPAESTHSLLVLLGCFAWFLLLAAFALLSYFAVHSTLGWLVDVLLTLLCGRRTQPHAACATNLHAFVATQYCRCTACCQHDSKPRYLATEMKRKLPPPPVESVLENGNDAIFWRDFLVLYYWRNRRAHV